MNTEQEREAFEEWWGKEGQYCRAGGGDYEKTFAYRAYQAGRAALQSQGREEAEVTAYALPGGISVERSMQRDGSFLWVIRDGLKKCLSKSGEWSYEPFPSSRTEEWLSQHRFSSAAEAIDHARRVEGAEQS